jgi:cell division protein ZapA (FtsZ GTPase activity inhibitor)
MAKTKKETINKQTITIDDKEYNVDDLEQDQIAFLNHITDLDRKMAQMRFNLDQLQAGRDTFARLLNESLNAEPELVD